MGALFLYNKEQANINITSVLKLFEEMGFSKPHRIETDQWNIYAYSKMVGVYNNCVEFQGVKMISIGTPLYKRLNYKDGLQELIRDYVFNRLNLSELKGHFNLLFIKNNRIIILSDLLRSKHLFVDKTMSIISSHMLAVCEGIIDNLSVNKNAVYEKLLTGIIMPPNTIFSNVHQINLDTEKKIERANIGVSFLNYQKNERYVRSQYSSKQQCLNKQYEALSVFFSGLKPQSESGIDTGLSGGYDSRLVLACMKRFINDNIHLHTHSTENVHQKDLNVALKMAEYVNVPCHIEKTNKLEHSENIDAVLRKSILYFDGRSSYSIGGCGEVYTAYYRKKSTENIPMTLTGIGGELYRNVFGITNKKFKFCSFMEEKVFSHSFKKAVSPIIYEYISKDVHYRAAKRLGIDSGKACTREIAHRYYCEVLMPDGQGTALDAYNQVSCCVAPFMEPDIIYKGYNTIPFHGSSGDFEGDLIAEIDEGLASIESSYGYPLNKRPAIIRIKEKVRQYVPADVWSQMSNLLHLKSFNKSTNKDIDNIFYFSSTLSSAFRYLRSLFPDVEFSYLLHTGEDVRRVQFIAMTLYYYKKRIVFSE